MCLKYLQVPIKQIFRRYGCEPRLHRCRLLVVGGGAGGCSVAWRLKKIFKESTIVLEPSEVHYYQPGFTLIGTGLKEVSECQKLTSSVLPRFAHWIKDSAETFDPCNDIVWTKCGRQIKYDYLVIAIGIENNYSQIQGLKKALDDPYSKVCTLYSPIYCQKTWCLLQEFCGGQAHFTFPNVPGKCAGASLKMAYMAHEYWQLRKILKSACMTYSTASNVTMSVPIYSIATRDILLKKGIGINYCFDLIEIHGSDAVFLDYCGTSHKIHFDFLHVTPPMKAPSCLRTCSLLIDDGGFLKVDPYTLKHKRFGNVFGLGDCTSTPNNKTAAAVALQSLVVAENITHSVCGHALTARYNGYGACPIITSYTKGILAEYLYDGKLAHTFPFDQTKERSIFFELVLHLYPVIYWNLMMKGLWSGPQCIRNIINPFERSSTATACKSCPAQESNINWCAIKLKLHKLKQNILSRFKRKK